MATLRFLADADNRELAVSSGLTASFSRNIATIDPDGTAAGVDKARIDEPVLFAAVPSGEETVVPFTNGYVFASGVDADGSTSLLLYRNSDGNKLSLFIGSSTMLVDTKGTESMQPAGCAFGPIGKVIWGADLRSEWITLMRLPDSGDSPTQAIIEHLYGWSTGTGHSSLASWSVVFLISQPRPELSTGSLLTCYGEDGSHDGADSDAGRILFCPDLSEPRQWAQVLSAREGGSTAAQHAG